MARASPLFFITFSTPPQHHDHHHPHTQQRGGFGHLRARSEFGRGAFGHPRVLDFETNLLQRVLHDEYVICGRPVKPEDAAILRKTSIWRTGSRICVVEDEVAELRGSESGLKLHLPSRPVRLPPSSITMIPLTPKRHQIRASLSPMVRSEDVSRAPSSHETPVSPCQPQSARVNSALVLKHTWPYVVFIDHFSYKY
jgi:hypothetical protein